MPQLSLSLLSQKGKIMIRKICKALGKSYVIKVIDLEEVIYRDFKNGFDVEISCCHKKKVNSYLWLNDNHTYVIARSLFGVPKQQIAETVEKLCLYSEQLISEGKNNAAMLMEVKHHA